MIRRAAFLSLLLALSISGCNRKGPTGPIDVDVIGPPIGTPRPAGSPQLDATTAALIGATGQGLVRFDASGQIVPGLAERWIVTDTGRSLIFRLPDAAAHGGEKNVDSDKVARRIRAAIAPNSHNPLKPLLGAIGEADAVTPQVLDVELTGPRPNMLQLFAQPELAMGGGRTGPFATVQLRNGVATLRARPDPSVDPEEAAAERLPLVRMRGTRAGPAIAHFLAGRSTLVLGGRFVDLPVARSVQLPKGTLRFDPAPGLFGFAFADVGRGFTAAAANRRALAMAIDRDRIAGLFAVPGWKPTTAIVAAGTPEIPQPATPDWTDRPIADRLSDARAVVAAWAGRGQGPTIRVAIPGGPGARLLFAAAAADWRRIGVAAIAVGPDQPAELRLIDEVAPADVASFYLRAFACDRKVPCTTVSDQVLISARDTPSLAERSLLLAQADALILQTVPFIPLGSPIRWSLVSPTLDLYRDSPRAIHPLNELRSPLKR